MLSVENVNANRGMLQVLWGVSFLVKDGEFVSIIGANGAGKSSLLSAISGIIQPSSGSIFFNGIKINGLPSNKLVDIGVSFVPEDKKLFANLTVKENLLLGAYTSRARVKEKEMFKMVYQLFPILKERESQLAMTLSGGEQRMLAISRALMSCPKLLILDEPSQGLAPKIVMEIFKSLRELKAQGIGILLAEQNVRLAIEAADRTYVLENGKIVLEGSGRQFLENEYIKSAFLGL
ncbi:MAG: ABC transporter ATP-binding protein [Candidatus Bathyarchaeia archaeon]